MLRYVRPDISSSSVLGRTPRLWRARYVEVSSSKQGRAAPQDGSPPLFCKESKTLPQPSPEHEPIRRPAGPFSRRRLLTAFRAMGSRHWRLAVTFRCATIPAYMNHGRGRFPSGDAQGRFAFFSERGNPARLERGAGFLVGLQVLDRCFQLCEPRRTEPLSSLTVPGASGCLVR